MKSAVVLAQSAIDTCIKLIGQKSDLSLTVVIDLIAKLGRVKTKIGFTEADVELAKIEEFYSGLKLSGDEPYVELWHQVLRYNQKIANEPPQSWQRKVEELVGNNYIKYDADEDLLC